MRNIELKESGVVFDDDKHTYHLDGKQLQGITGMIGRQLFPDTYKSVPKDILEKARKRGSTIHRIIQDCDNKAFYPNIIEVQNYFELKDKYKLITEANEYIVTDREHFASPIDIVYRTGTNTFSLADLKTTNKLYTESVRWQLSIYAFLFELQNPKCKVDKLFAIHLHGEIKEIVELDRIPADIICELLQCEVDGKQYKNEVEPMIMAPVEFIKAEPELKEINEKIKELKSKKDDILNKMMDLLKTNNDKSYKGNLVQVIYKPETERISVDNEKLQNDYADAYNACIKVSTVKESITLKVL